MRNLVLAGIILALTYVPARAQIATIGVFADATGTDSSIVAGGSGMLELYIVVNYPAGVTTVEFMAPNPGCFNATYLGQTSPFPVLIGDSQTGVAVGLAGCYGGAVNVLTLRYWINDTTACCLYPVHASPGYGEIRIVDCNQTLINAETVESIINGSGSCFPPTPPANPTPADGQTDVDVVAALSWESIDPYGNPPTFDVYFGTTPDPPLVAADLTSPSYIPDILSFDTRFYWKVAAEDDDGNEVFGPEWQFTTTASTNALLVVSDNSNWCGPVAIDTVVFDVQIINSDYPVASGGFDVTYDNTRLDWLSWNPGDLTQGWQGLSCTDLGAAIRVVGSGPEPIPVGNSGTFIQLVFLSNCCGIDSVTTSFLCPENTTGDLRTLGPVCGQFQCDFYPADGDVDSSGSVTPGDALCALHGYLSFPDPPDDGCGTAGWDVRSDVDCSGNLTPADALCIFHSWLDGSCTFCSAGPFVSTAKGEPGYVTVSSVIHTDTEVSVTLSVSGVGDLEAFGFDIRYPAGAVAGVAVYRTSVTTGFNALVVGKRDDTSARVGAYAASPVAVAGTADLVKILFDKTSAPAAGTITIAGFVDDLAGAGPVSIDLAATQETDTPVITRYALYQNQPNPFNPDTEIRYEIPDGTTHQRVTLSIYDVTGKRVRQLVDRIQGGGLYDERWDGRNDSGSAVSSGVFFYVLRADGQTITRKMVLLR